MKRKIAAALAFNMYALIFVQAFWQATPLLFHGKEIMRLKDQGVPFNFDEWGGFGNHYLWRLLAAIVSTALAAFICGAIAREKGGKVALLANIPSAIGWIAYLCSFFLYDSFGFKEVADWEGLKTAYVAVSIIAIPLTCLLAIKGGEIGERFQMDASQEDKTLQIADWHWAWIWLPLSLYGYKIIITTVAFIAMTWKTGADISLLGTFLYLLGMVIVAAWIAPLVLAYQTLAGTQFQDTSRVQRAGIIAVILIGGYFIATAIAYVFGRILEKFGF